jgi:cyclophilin family peptidyl-prolyl cis-trans isomerase
MKSNPQLLRSGSPRQERGRQRRSIRFESLERREMLTYVEMDTAFGTIHMMSTHSAPADAFAHAINMDDYDGSIFHRLVPGATLSAGRYYVDGSAVQATTFGTLSYAGNNLRGTIGAIPREGTNQPSGAWYINLADNPHLDAAGYMVIGRVEAEDMHIVDAIAALPTFDVRGHESIPLQDYVMQDPPQLPAPENYVVISDARLTPIQVSMQDGQVVEGDDGVTYGFVYVQLNVSASWTVQIRYITEGGAATPDQDYQLTSGTLTLNPGETGRTIRVPIYSDRDVEENEAIRVRILESTGGAVIDDEAILTILDDDGGVAGDTNFDNVVDLVDLNNVRNYFGAQGESQLGDVTGDGVVDLADLNMVRNHFGERAEIPTSAISHGSARKTQAAYADRRESASINLLIPSAAALPWDELDLLHWKLSAAPRHPRNGR